MRWGRTHINAARYAGFATEQPDTVQPCDTLFIYTLQTCTEATTAHASGALARAVPLPHANPALALEPDVFGHCARTLTSLPAPPPFALPVSSPSPPLAATSQRRMQVAHTQVQPTGRPQTVRPLGPSRPRALLQLVPPEPHRRRRRRPPPASAWRRRRRHPPPASACDGRLAAAARTPFAPAPPA